MTNEQLNAIIGLLAGTQTAIVALVKSLEAQGVITDMERTAQIFERHAQDLPEGVPNRELMATVIRHIVIGLRDPGHDPSGDLSRKLH